VSIGSILSEALGLYQRFFARFFLTAAAVYVVIDLLAAIANDAAGDGGLGAVFWGLVALLVFIVGVFWVQGALVAAVQDVRDGRIDTSIGDLYDHVRPRLPALIAAGVLAALGIIGGLILLIVPGLYLLTRWILIAPVIVLEGRSAGESFGRSTELVRGRGWSVFGVIVVTFLLAAIAHAIFLGVFSFLPDFLMTWIGGVVADSLVTPFVALASTVMYYRLSTPTGVVPPGEAV
jgi:Membrane domain of glycerophosphoryl diester phosphodiesterase